MGIFELKNEESKQGKPLRACDEVFFFFFSGPIL